LKEIWRGLEDEEEDVRSYWMTFRKRKDAGNWERSNRSPFVENCLWKRLWSYHTTGD
jgi:hypothetical protein